VVLLIDTYDTEAAADKVVALADRLRAQGIAIQGVRLDSGDLADHARRVRRILDAGGLTDTTIFASGNLDEFTLRDMISCGAPVDGFGIGSRLDVSADAPYLDCAYKLQEYAGRPRRKRSEGKATWPGRKQVYRTRDGGVIAGDVVTLADDPQPGEALLHCAMSAGRRLQPAKPLDEIRKHAALNLAELPPPLRQLDDRSAYPVTISAPLRALADSLDASMCTGSLR
jgi:nicotinate phosphoribosyltransferase